MDQTVFFHLEKQTIKNFTLSCLVLSQWTKSPGFLAYFFNSLYGWTVFHGSVLGLFFFLPGTKDVLFNPPQDQFRFLFANFFPDFRPNHVVVKCFWSFELTSFLKSFVGFFKIIRHRLLVIYCNNTLKSLNGNLSSVQKQFLVNFFRRF